MTVTCAYEADASFDAGALPHGDVPVYRDAGELFDAESVDVAWISASNQETPRLIETASGAVGTLNAGYLLPEYDTTVAVYGTEGQADWDPSERDAEARNPLTLTRTADEPRSAPTRRRVYEFEDTPGYGGAVGLDYFEAYLRAREEGLSETMVASLADGREVLAVLDAAYESARTGEWASVDGRGSA